MCAFILLNPLVLSDSDPKWAALLVPMQKSMGMPSSPVPAGVLYEPVTVA